MLKKDSLVLKKNRCILGLRWWSDLTDVSSQLESYIQENMRSEMVEMQRNVINTQAATMLEIGTNLLSQSAEHTRKLTNVETQVTYKMGLTFYLVI